jgi:hypothetical protein
MRNVALAALLTLVAAAPVRAQPSPGRAVDVEEDDATVLEATYFPAAKPGPGVILFPTPSGPRPSGRRC